MNILSDLLNHLETYYQGFIELVPRLGVALLVCLFLYIILKRIKKRFIRYLRFKAEDKLLANFAESMLSITIGILLTLLFMYIVGLGAIATSLLGAAGLSAFVIGFALKDIGENFLAGVIMAFDRPFRLGDTIKTGDVVGIIVEMSLRDTHVKTFDGKDVYVPNGQIIKNPLYNYTIDGFLRHSFTIGIDYDSDVEQARQIILDTVSAVPGVLKEDKTARTHVNKLGSSTIEIEVQFWTDTFDKSISSLEIKSQAQSKAVVALVEANIGMPADILELKNYDHSLQMKQAS